jgi:hypothetical protein
MEKNLEENKEVEPKEKIKEESKAEIEKAMEIPNENKKKINPLLIILVILIAIAFLVGAFILGTKFADKEDKKEKDNNNTSYTISIYGSEDGFCEQENEDCELIGSIPVKTKEAKILKAYEESQVKHILYNDETLKIYNIETKSISETNLKAEYDEYDFQLSYDSKEFYTVYALKEEMNSLLNEALSLDALNQISEYANTAEENNTFHRVKAPEDGIIVYYIDGFEGVTVDNFEASIHIRISYAIL